MIFKFFENITKPFPAEEPEQPPQKFWSFIWHYAKPFRWLFLASIVVSASLAFLEVYLFETIGSLVDWMGATEPSSFLEAEGHRLITMAILIVVIWPLIAFFDEAVMLQGVMGNMAMQIRWRGHRYLLRQSAGFFADEFAGRLATKLMQTALGTRDTLTKLTNLLVYMIVYFGSAAILFAGADLRLVVPLLFWFVGYGLIMRFFLPRMRDISEAQSDARSDMTGKVVDAYSNIQTVKMFSSKQAEDNYAKSTMSNMLIPVYGQMRLATQLSLSLHIINSLLITGSIGVGIYLWTGSIVSIGAVAFVGAMALRIQGISHYFLWEIANLFENIGMVEDGRKTLAQANTVPDTGTQPLAIKQGNVSFNQVSFNYGKERTIIDTLSLTIKSGEKFGLVGRSGAGKSTLVNLLLRFYDVESGTIKIDDQDISTVTQDSLRQKIAVVSQDTSLLHRTIRENVAYGRPDASEEEIIQALKDAEAWDFVQNLEDNNEGRGLDARVGERGVKLSGGQRQRIAIARVILKDAPILILDEATSALDSEIEMAIQSQLDRLMKGKTVIAIAHRLSTIAALDRLVIMDEGRIIETGTHESLIAENGVYADLWARQSGGFLEGVRQLGPTAAE